MENTIFQANPLLYLLQYGSGEGVRGENKNFVHSAVVFGLLLLSFHHLGYSFGDDLFRWAGIPPWTDIGRKTGLHLLVVAAMVLLIFGIRGIVKIYKPVYPKILSRTLLACAGAAGNCFLWGTAGRIRRPRMEFSDRCRN